LVDDLLGRGAALVHQLLVGEAAVVAGQLVDVDVVDAADLDQRADR
jgi:hypothetical protein